MKKTLALLAAVMALPLCGQTVAYTIPSGYVKTDLAVGFNPIGINLHGEILISGIIDSESANVITDADVDFAATLTDADATYLLEVVNGSQNGAVSVITASTANTVTIEGPGISAGTASYTIRKSRTLNDIFGTGANAQLEGRPTPAGADTIWLPDGNGSYDNYFYSTLGGANEFRSTETFTISPSKPVPIFYPDGLFVQIATTPKTITLFGEVKTTQTILGAIEGFNLVSLQNPVGQTLDQSNLESVIRQGPTPSLADILWLPDGAGNYDTVFFSTLGGANKWRLTTNFASGDEGLRIIPQAFFIQRSLAAPIAGPIQLPPFFSTL